MRTPRTLPCLASCNTHCAARLSSTSYPIHAHDAPAMGWPHSTQCLRSFSSSPPIAPAARSRHAALATHRVLFLRTQPQLPSRNSNPNPNPTSIQIPPGLAGSESENSYTNRMGMSKDYKK